MNRKLTAVSTAALVCSVGGVIAQGADWLTDGGNPQRTEWQKDEKILSPASAKNIKLLWKMKLDNEPRQMHSLFPPLIIDTIVTSGGAKQIAIVRRRFGQHLRHRCGKRRSGLEEAFRKHLYAARNRRTRRRNSMSRRANRHSRHRTRGAPENIPFTPLRGTGVCTS